MTTSHGPSPRTTRPFPLRTAAMVALAVGGGVLIWSVASYVPGDACPAIYPPTRGCNTGLRQHWASYWIAFLAITAVLGVVLSLKRSRDHRLGWAVLAAQGVLIAVGSFAVRPW